MPGFLLVRRTTPDEGLDGIYRIEMEITRLSGDVASWKRLNTTFLTVLRKRFLVWRTVSEQMRKDYLEAGKQLTDVDSP